MKKFRELRNQLKEDIFGNIIKTKISSKPPPLSSQQKKIMDGIKNILAKDSSEMNVRKANITIDKYSRANPQVDEKSIIYMRKMIDAYTPDAKNQNRQRLQTAGNRLG